MESNKSSSSMKINKNIIEKKQIFIHDEKSSLFDKKITIFISPKKTIRSLRNIIANKIPNKKQKHVLTYVRKSIHDCPSDIILRGKEMVNISKHSFNLIFDGKLLKDNDIIEQCGIQSLSNIILMTNTPQIKGGRLYNFVDLRKNNIKKIKLSNDGQAYRICDKGLNILGLCTNKQCKTKGKEVISPIGYGEFDLKNAIDEMDIRCPICSQVIKPKTCGFMSCAYNFVGTILENGKVEPFKSETYEALNDYLIYYKPSEKLGEWVELKIYILPNKNNETLSGKNFKDIDYFDC